MIGMKNKTKLRTGFMLKKKKKAHVLHDRAENVRG